MENFRQTSNTGNYEVYTGFWTDWTNGPIFGATVTLNKRDGSLLIAFIALFVSLVGTCFWRICCFALHQFYSTHVAQDALYHQRQAIFRNAANGSSGLWRLLNVWWEWRKTSVDRPSQRLLPAAGFAICCIFAFATAGTFSSKISTAANGVLVRSSECGILDSDNNQNLEDAVLYYYPWSAQIISSWSIYAQDCYLNVSDLGSCNAFIQPQLPSKIDRNASCPFQDGICENEYGNIEFETYLDSHSDLGLNAPADERVMFRRVSSCAPIKTDGHRSRFYSPETAMNYSRYFYGPTGYVNYTYEYPEVIWSSAPSMPGSVSNGGGRYTVQVQEAFISNGSYEELSAFEPIPALRQQDADVHLILMSANSIVYTEEVTDPWYSATTSYTNITSADKATGKLKVYRADNPVSVLACTVKEQYCNPNLPADERCSPFGGTYESPSLAADIWSNNNQRTAFNWLSAIVYAFSVTVEVVPGILREGGLLAGYKSQNGVSGALPTNQWQLEAESWHAATLVALQGSMTQVAKGTSDENLKSFLRAPNNTAERNLCNNQKIPTASHSNFSVFGLALTLALGSAVVLLSYVLEPLTACFQHRRHSRRATYARLEWVTDETLQLQRQAYEQAGMGEWTGCAGNVPVTKGGERLAGLDLEDLECPRLMRAASRREVERFGGGEKDGGGGGGRGSVVDYGVGVVGSEAQSEETLAEISVERGRAGGLDG
ncbi:Cytochrome p450 protein [Lasiodiplodia theobromae]|uniref:Cytochrome p450 protein n=1 Tax=Lasiodiplodia theobromae TaxID=45133 RepID=UPI0015C3C274|nr:Cytochrome p450 protein [Lasiodiplodia theobromae]KAF4540320.1 Cytochrome p450 protein [Lasiodiplodia theobromae]